MHPIYFRGTFLNKIDKSILDIRIQASEICRKNLRKSSFNDELLNDTVWNEGWNKMKADGYYEEDYFGDLFVAGRKC